MPHPKRRSARLSAPAGSSGQATLRVVGIRRPAMLASGLADATCQDEVLLGLARARLPMLRAELEFWHNVLDQLTTSHGDNLSPSGYPETKPAR